MSAVAAIALIATLTVAAVTDCRRRVIPNRLTLPAATLAAVIAARGGADGLATALLASTVIAAPLLAAHLARPAGMGMGDVKLVAVAGLFLGWQAWPGLLAGLALAALTGTMICLGKRIPPSLLALPLAPFLAAGFLPVTVALIR